MPPGASAFLWGCALLVVECRPLLCMLCPIPAPDGSPAPPRYPCLPGGYHVALWRAAEGGAYHGHAAFALSWGGFLEAGPIVGRHKQTARVAEFISMNA